MLRGSIPALITPFDPSGGIDFSAFENLIEWHIQEGSSGIVICGTTGESPTLDDDEQEELLRRAIAVGKNRIPIIAGTGTYDTRKTVKKTEIAKRLGADASLVIVPYYNRPTPEGCIEHFQKVSEVGIPTIVYHHPGRTGIKLSADTLIEILKLPNMIGLKDASEDLELCLEILSEVETLLFTGIDSLLLPYLSIGAVGVISIIANVIPREWSEVVATRSLELMKRYYPLSQAMVFETNPQCVKYAVSLLGKCEPHMRAPLRIPREENQKKIRTILSSYSESLSILS